MIEPKFKILAKGRILKGETAEIIHQRALEAMYEITSLLEREVGERTPVGVGGAKGGLRSAIFGEVIDFGGRVRGIIGHQSAYGEVIERGRRAGQRMPPEGSLLRWIEMKIGAAGKEAERIEFVIRRKIGRKGFPGAHMFEIAWRRNLSLIKEIFNRAGFKITKDFEK